MKTFRCDHCGHPLYFENVQCLRCGSSLAFLPDRLALCAIEPAGPEGQWRRKTARGRRDGAPRYRLCQNMTAYQACNFAVPAQDPNELCASCRQTRVLPDLSLPANVDRWYHVEIAKRRLFFTLARLGLLDPTPPDGGRDGPVFEFKADMPGQMVLTGHAEGVITLNVAEADDAERTTRRVQLHEPYRTLLGHLRHESGHYYWDRLIDEGGRLEACRRIFGDDSINYGEALQRHYASGGHPAGWEQQYVSAYATSHPWEDWAETWAHYLHMVDLLETAASYNTRLEVPGVGTDEVEDPLDGALPDFEQLVDQWVPVTLLVNSLNRSLGQGDAYPFALSPPALEKLRFIHDVIRDHRRRRDPQAPATARPGPVAEPASAMAQREPAERA